MNRKALLRTLLVSGHFVVVSAPLAFIVGVFVIIFAGVNAGIIAGALTAVIFVSWASYATYSWNASELDEPAEAA